MGFGVFAGAGGGFCMGTPATSYLIYTEAGPSDILAEQFERDAKVRGERLVEALKGRAGEAGVSCETLLLTNDHPWEGIIAAPTTTTCDLIFMSPPVRPALSP